MMLKIATALIVVLAAASLTPATPVRQESDNAETVARLCGRLEHTERIPDKINPIKYSEKNTPIKDAKLLAYERRDNAACCKTSSVIAETTTSKSGAFEFKGLPSGNYWFVAMVDQQQYTIPVVIQQTRDKQPVCSELSFAIQDSGKFVLRVRAPGR